MISVYLSNETNFNNNGLTVLEPSSCEIALTINGAWVLKLVHPFDNEGKYKYLEFVQENQGQRGNIIKITDITALRDCDSTQLFRIYNSVKSLSDITVTAFPVGMEATYDAIIEELKLENKTGKQVGTALAALVPNKYTLTVSSSLTKKRSVEYKNTNLIAALCGSDEGSFVNKFQAEVAYNNYEIKVKKRLGTTTDHDVRIGKNLTGLTYDIDDSAVVTRLYPISQDGLRLYDKTDMRYLPPLSPDRYIDSEDHWEDYPFTRAAFVEVPYSLVDTDTDAEVKTKTITHTAAAFTAIFEAVYSLMADFWADIVNNNEFDYSGSPYSFTIDAVPGFIQSVIGDISTTIAEKVLGSEATDSIYITQPSLRNWLTSAIKAGIEWIKDEELQEPEWVENQDGSYSYGTSSRLLTSEWGDIDNKMSYFGADTKWQKEKDDPFDWAWVQKKGQAKKYGNNKRYLARNTYVYDYDGECKYYWFDEEGWWDGTSETSGWGWHSDSTGWWFGDADPDGDDTKYIHDDWAFIRETSSSPRKLYYFDSDGYLDDSKTETVDWNWHKVNGRWYFGSASKDSRATYLTSQWMKIDGDWYHFDSNGYVFDLEQAKLQYANDLAVYIVQEAEDTFTAVQDDLYDVLYENMEEYCSDLYANGLDLPAISVTVDFVDLSKTAEYANYSNLERVCLGDDVMVHDEVHGIDSIEERVMGLTYDCLKGCNTQISVGGTTSVTSLFDNSVKGTGNEQRLVAGENVTIDGNVINVSANTGDVYAGDKVSVTQLQTTGNPIAKIYVNGIPTTIYAVGSDVEVEPIKTEGDKIATITVGGVDYDIYADTGLKYWVETETDIYRTGQRDEISGSDTYLKKSTLYLTTHGALVKCEARKANNKPALCAYVQNQTQGTVYGTFYISTKNVDAEWEWRSWVQPYGQEGYWGDWREPGQQGQTYTLYDTTASFEYKGATWYVHVSSKLDTYEPTNISMIPYDSSENSIVDTAKRIIDLANASPYTEDIVGISNQDHILYYNDDKKKNYDTENRDDAVYISKDGIFNGSEFRVNGVAIGAFYKTNLYLGISYASTINLSDSYTAYDLLMIETYNQDDKKNLASVVNVSDLTSGSYVGVNEYLMYTITNARTLTFHEAPSDSNHSRYINAIYGLRTGRDSGVEPVLTDVIVDGESVVAGGIATINNKQNKLTAGNNITINNNVINATDTTYSDFAGSSHGLVPSASSGDSSKYLKGDGTWGTPDTGTTYTAGANIQISEQNVISATDTTYSDFNGSAHGLVPVPSSGDSNKYLKGDGTWDEPEGTTVIANPSGTATDTITKIQVENTIYDIASGSYIEVATSILQSYTEWTEKYTSGMVAYYSSDKIYFSTASYTDSDRAMAVYKVQIPASVKKIRYSITQKRTDAQDPTQDMYKLCVGVKSSYDDVNYSTPTDSDFLVKNLHEFEAYNVVTNGELDISSISSTVYLYIIANGFACEVTKVEVVEYKAGLEDLSDVNIMNPSNGQVLTYDSTNQEWVNANASGGTTVVANPSGSATATLTKLQVENTIYEVSGGGGASDLDDLSDVDITTPSNGQVLQYDSATSKWVNATPSGDSYTRTKLFDNNYVLSNNQSVTLDSAYDNFDELEFVTFKWDTSNIFDMMTSLKISVSDLEEIRTGAMGNRTNLLALLMTNNFWKRFTITNKSTFTYHSNSGNWAVCKVYGIKYSNGAPSGGGSISALSKSDYDNLSQAEKNNGTLYLVEGGGESSYSFSHDVLGTTYGYNQLPSNIYHLAVVVSLNGTVYGGFIHDYINRSTAVMSSSELTRFATALSMNVNTSSGQTVYNGTTAQPYEYWSNGGNHDYLYLDAQTNSVGIKCGYAGCKASLFYTLDNGDNQIIRNEVVYSSYYPYAQ